MYNLDSHDQSCSPPDIPGYQIISELGRGGMGVVYQARHTDTGEIRALKTVFSASESQLAGIHREIRTLANVSHPGIVAILDRGDCEGLPWYAMEFVSGLLLLDYLGVDSREIEDRWWTYSLSRTGQDRLPRVKTQFKRRHIDRELQDRITTLIRRICSPLAYLHGEGIIHKDLKPGNILVRENGAPVIMDFGLISMFSSRNHREILDDTEIRTGTIRYMAPEQLSGEFMDARVDIYALGCIFYELLTGMVPRETVYALNRTQKEGLPEIPPSEVADGIPAEIDELVMAMIARDPNNRIGYAVDIARQLRKSNGKQTIFRHAPDPRIYLHRPRFTGRTDTLKHLDNRIAKTIAHIGHVFFIGGESGIGKTRLVMELAFRSRMAGITTLFGECHPNRHLDEQGSAGDTVLLGAFRKPLETVINICLSSQKEELCHIFSDLAPTLSLYQPLIRSLPGFKERPEAEPVSTARHKELLFKNLGDLFLRLSRIKTLLLIIDDLQWADPYTTEFLNYLLEKNTLTNSRICVFGTFRTEEITPEIRQLQDHGNSDTIILDRMGSDDVYSIIRDMLGFRDIDATMINRLTEISEGNPFYIAEYLLACVDDNLLVRDPMMGWRFDNTEISRPGRWPAFPESLQRLMENRLDLLDSTARKQVDICSCIGKEINIELLDKVNRQLDNTWEDAVNELKIRQILFESAPGILRFFHDKLRETAYNTLPKDRKKRVHRTIAETVETQFPELAENYPVEMGTHWENAGMFQRAVPYFESGANRYLERFAMKEADELFEKCLRFTMADPAGNAELRISRARSVYLDNGRYELALADYKKACEDAAGCGNTVLQADAYNGLLETYGRTGEFKKAWEAGEIALSLYDGENNRYGAAGVQGNLAMICARQGQFRDAVKRYKSAVTVFEEINEDNRLSWVLQNLALSYFSLYETQKSIALLEHVYDLSMKIGNRLNAVRALSYQASIHAIIGNPDKAETCIKSAIELNRETGNRQLEALDRVKLARLYADSGRLTEALDHVTETESTHREFNDFSSLGQNHLVRGMVYQMQGRLIDAVDCFRQARKIFSELNYSPMVAECAYKIALADFHLHAGDTQVKESDEALELARKLQDRDFSMDCLILYYNCCLYADDTGRLVSVRKDIEALLDNMELDPDRKSGWTTLGDLYAVLGQTDKALELYEEVYKSLRKNAAGKLNPGIIIQLCFHRRANGVSVTENGYLLDRVGKRIREMGAYLYEPEWLVEKGYLALDQGKSGTYWVNRARTSVKKLGWDSTAPVNRLIDALASAVQSVKIKQSRDQ